MAKLSRTAARQKRHRRIRRRIQGTAEVPRMAVCTTGKHVYVQFIDDDRGHTLAAVSTLDPKMKSENVKPTVDGAEALGKEAAARAQEAGISEVVFDRGGFQYHGRIRKLAEAARASGLKF